MVLLFTLLATLGSVLQSVPAQAGPIAAVSGAEQIHVVAGEAAIIHGAGVRTKNGTWFGQWMNNGRRGYCIDPLLNAATMPWYSQSVVTGLTPTQVARLSFIVTKWGNTTSNSQAAAVRMALLLIVDSKSIAVTRGLDTKNGLSAAVVKWARGMITVATTQAGPYRVRLSVPQAAAPGSRGQVKVVVLSASGRTMPATVTLVATNARLASTKVSTGASGAGATVSFTRATGTAPVSVTGSVSMTSSAVLITRPPKGFQRLVSYGSAQAVKGTVTYQKALGSATISYVCDNECLGEPPVSVKACNNSSVQVNYVVYDNGRAVSRFALAAGACGTRSVAVPDTHTVTASWQMAGGAVTTFAARVAVDCPPFPDIVASVKATCAAGNVTANMPRNTTTHTQRMFINGVLRQELKPGQDLPPITMTVPCGNNTMVNFAAAVQRNNGQWNKGESIAVLVR